MTTQPARPATPVIIDTDPGIDDLLAIWAALGTPLLEVRALVSVHGNIAQAMAHHNLTRLLAFVHHESWPLLGTGAVRPLVADSSESIHDIHGDDGLGGVSARFTNSATELGADELPALSVYEKVLTAAAEPITIIALGPLTNVAILLAARPELRSKIARIVMMGGGDGVGNTTAAAEFNIASDPEAAERVFSDEVPVTMVGLDVTHAVRFGSDWLDQLRTRGEVAEVAAAACVDYMARFESRTRDGMALHDAVAVAVAARPDLAQTRVAAVVVDHDHGVGRGATFVDPRPASAAGRAAVTHVLSVAAQETMAWVADSIAALRPR